MTLRRNDDWAIGDWNYFAYVKPAELVEDFVKRVSEEKALLGVWALLEGAELHIYSLIESDRETERRLHAVELEVLRNYKYPPIEFHVYRDPNRLRSHVGNARPVLVA